MNTPSTIRELLYELKREYGNYAVLYQRVVNNVNVQTGAKDVSENIYEIKRCIILPYKLLTKFFQLNQQPAFKYGGEIDLEKRMLVIDVRDLPKGIQIGTEDYFLIDHKRYVVADVEEWEKRSAYLVTVQQSKPTAADETILIKAFNNIFFNDTVTAEVE